MERRIWTGGFLPVVAAAAVLVFGFPRPSPAAGPGAAGVKRLLEDSGISYKWDDELKLGTVEFKDLEYTCENKVLVYANADDGGYYVILNLCLMDMGPGYRFPQPFLKKCMELNNSLYVLRLGLNSKRGRIYATIGVDMSDLPASILKDYVMQMAKRGDEVAKELKEFLKSGGSQPASAPAAGGGSADEKK